MPLQRICTLEHFAALMGSNLTIIWGIVFLMCHFKVQGTQVKENEVLYLQLYEEIMQDCKY